MFLTMKMPFLFLLIVFQLASLFAYAQPDKDFLSLLNDQSVSIPSSVLSGDGKAFPIDLLSSDHFKVLAIGEQSHGTSEFYKARVSFLKMLASRHQRIKIGLEAPMAEVEELNTYLLENHGDLKEILKSFRLYNYECTEFIDLIERVQELNISRPEKITFFGFDFQSPFQSLQNIMDYSLKHDISNTASIKKLIGYYKLLNNETYSHTFSKADFDTISSESRHALSYYDVNDKTKSTQAEKIHRNIENYRQFLFLNNPSNSEHNVHAMSLIRDSLMAENVYNEIVDSTMIILFAHNAHIQKTANPYSKSMGYFLRSKLGDEYKSVALTTSQGFYTAFNSEAGRIIDTNKIISPDAEAFEFYFSQINKPVFFLETSAMIKQSIDFLPNEYKILPMGYTAQQFVQGNIFADFDYILHIANTTGSESFYLQ